MTAFRALLNGFLVGLLIFILANILAVHLLSHCGVSALLGTDSCAEILRVQASRLFSSKKADSLSVGWK